MLPRIAPFGATRRPGGDIEKKKKKDQPVERYTGILSTWKTICASVRVCERVSVPFYVLEFCGLKSGETWTLSVLISFIFFLDETLRGKCKLTQY